MKAYRASQLRRAIAAMQISASTSRSPSPLAGQAATANEEPACPLTRVLVARDAQTDEFLGVNVWEVLGARLDADVTIPSLPRDPVPHELPEIDPYPVLLHRPAWDLFAQRMGKAQEAFVKGRDVVCECLVPGIHESDHTGQVAPTSDRHVTCRCSRSQSSSISLSRPLHSDGVWVAN